MEELFEIFKPCLVLIGPFLFFAFKRLFELQESNMLRAHGLSEQDFVEKLTKTPLHMEKCRRILDKEKQLSFDRERHLMCQCKALRNRLQYEISKNEHLNSLYVDQVFRQNELLKEIRDLKNNLKKQRKNFLKRKRLPVKFYGKTECCFEYEKACKFCYMNEKYSNICLKHFECSCEQIERENCCKESPSQSVFSEDNDQNTKYMDNQLSYYQTFFS